jgi:hypothetical protein
VVAILAANTAHTYSCGVSLPAVVGTVTASWPFGILEFSSTVVSVNVRPAIIKSLIVAFMATKPDDSRSAPVWAEGYAHVSGVRATRRALVMFSDETGSGVRLVMIRKERLASVVRGLRAQGVDVQEVRSTLGWFVRPGR